PCVARRELGRRVTGGRVRAGARIARSRRCRSLVRRFQRGALVQETPPYFGDAGWPLAGIDGEHVPDDIGDMPRHRRLDLPKRSDVALRNALEDLPEVRRLRGPGTTQALVENHAE